MNLLHGPGLEGSMRLPAMIAILVAGLGLSLATAARADELLYVPNSTKWVNQLTGDLDKASNKPTLSQTDKRYGVASTDLGSSFEHKGKLYFLFGDTNGGGRPKDADVLAWTTSTDPGKIVLEFFRAKDGRWLPLTVPGVRMSTLEVPSGGISINGVIYLVVTTDGDFAKNIMGRSVLARSDDDGKTFKKLYDLSTDKFINVSFLSGADGWVYIFGSGKYRASSVCLARVKSADLGTKSKLEYFNKDRAPNWFPNNEAAASVLFTHDQVGEFSVAYLPPVKRFVMLYNAGAPR
ncbi:MAG: DUF4185 domain-containing protein, partial [Planctomycetia bacterium]|nr:DUF4185 domain-containing protein [Planctomycetia bacterium]